MAEEAERQRLEEDARKVALAEKAAAEEAARRAEQEAERVPLARKKAAEEAASQEKKLEQLQLLHQQRREREKCEQEHAEMAKAAERPRLTTEEERDELARTEAAEEAARQKQTTPPVEEEDAEASEEAEMQTTPHLLPWCPMIASGWLAPRSWMSMPGGTALASSLAQDLRQTMVVFRFEMFIRILRRQENHSATDTSLFRQSNRQARMLDQVIEDLGASLSYYRQLVEAQGISAQAVEGDHGRWP